MTTRNITEYHLEDWPRYICHMPYKYPSKRQDNFILRLLLTLKCHKGRVHIISFFTSPVKTCKDFFRSFLVIALLSVTHHLVKKKWYRPRHFHANYHKWALLHNVTKLVLVAILNRIIFLQFYFKNVNVFMFFIFQPNLIVKFSW